MPEIRFIQPRTAQHPFTVEERPRLPHILSISIDMVPTESYADDSPYAAHLRLPNLRALWDGGVRFTNAFAVSPLCGPSRAGYLTGRYPYITVNEERAHDGQAVALRESDVIYPEYLKALGYQARHVGKSHIGTEVFTRAFSENDVPWNRWAPPLTDDDGYLAYLRQRGIQPMRYRRELAGLAPDRHTPGNRYGGWVVQANGDPFPLEGTYPFYLAHRAAETLETMLRRAPDQPLYLQLDFFEPHQPFCIPAGFEEREQALREVSELPASYWAARQRDFRAAADEPRIYEVYRRHWGLYDPRVAREYILGNLLQMEVLDAAIGAFLDEVRRRGLYDDALIVFLGDHGEMNAHRALIDKGVYGHPRVARAPLALKLPGGAQAGRRVETPVSLLDLAPTVLEAAGVRPLARLDGESLWPRLRGESPARAKPILFEAHWHVAPNPAVALIAELGRGRYMYTCNLTSEVDELYDLADPAGRNLAADPALAEVKAALIRELGRVLSADPRWRCYWHPLRLDRFDLVGGGQADMQMLVPKD